MKTILLFLFVTSAALAQFPAATPNQLEGSAGLTWINNQPFYSFRLRPELSFSTIGVGLDLNLEFDSHGKLRKENFNEFSDYASLIRYIRYGNERDEIFVKLGALDYATIGHGSIINNYNNSPSFDSRKIGLQLNGNFDKCGFQSLYGNFGQAGVVGVRGYVRPLQFTDLSGVPVLSTIEIGATYSIDFDQFANVSSISVFSTSGIGKPVKPPVYPRAQTVSIDTVGSRLIQTNGDLQIVGADIGLPVIHGDFAGLELYGDAVKIIDFGNGFATGVRLTVDGIPLVNMSARVERRFNGERYLPSYFDSFYELERFNSVTGISKSLALRNIDEHTKGVYGDLLIRLVNTFDVYGSYERVDERDSSGRIHLTTDLSPRGSPIVARASYDKVNIIDFKDFVTTDDRSYLKAEIGYKPIEYLIISVVYQWTFTPVREGDTIIGYEPQKKIEPRISFVFPLGSSGE